MNNCIKSENLITLDFSKTPKNDIFNSFGTFNIDDSFHQAKSVVDELIEISTSESEEVSARGVFSKDNIFSPRKLLIKNCLETNNIKNELPISTQIIDCVDAFPHNNYNEFSLLLGQCQKNKEENLGSSLKLVEHDEYQIKKVESMVSHYNNINNNLKKL